jgi:protein-L-isoaspartate(D-aspartate) O-methyltransferase
MDEEELSNKYDYLINRLIEGGVLKTLSIIEAFRKALRYKFVREGYLDMAHLDIPLPIGIDSTISQPSTVATMLEELSPKEGEKILEIGTASGWQATILSFCVGDKGKVVTIEINKEISEFGKHNIERFNVKNVEVINADGADGYKSGAPYDKIIFTAALPKIKKRILMQLKVGGKLIAPVGEYLQTMVVITRTSENKFVRKRTGSFLFVPIKRGQGVAA